MTGSIQIFEKKKIHSKTTYFRVPQGQTSSYDRLAHHLQFSSQHTYYTTTNDNQLNFVDEYSLFPAFSWTSYYQITNLLAHPLCNTPEDNESGQSRHHKLTSALLEIHCTIIGLNQTFNRFIAQRVNRFSINNYDRAITR